MECTSCGHDNIDKARFCTNCGASLKGLSGRIKGLTQKFVHQTNKTVEEYRHKADKKITELLSRMDANEAYIGSYKIPDSRKPVVRKALLRFQEQIGGGSPHDEMSYEKWISNLPSMLEGQKCVVCFSNFDKTDDLLICPHCETGGHKEHIISWVEQSRQCPFCRQSLIISQLVQLG